jgi:hypothetical protein
VVLNPIHGRFDPITMHLWEGRGTVAKTDHGLKVGCMDGITLRRIAVPKIPPLAKIRFGILVALRAYRDKNFCRWARAWLSGDDRSRGATRAAEAWGAAAAARAARTARTVEAAARAAAAGKTLPLAALLRKAIRDEAALAKKKRTCAEFRPKRPRR